LVLGIPAALAAPAVLSGPALAAEFAYKLGSALPDGHPAVIRWKEAAGKIAEETNGRLKITVYNNNALGQDTSMISQAMSGALEMYSLAMDLFAPRNRACGIFGVGFSFAGPDQAWAAMDGELGDYVRGIVETAGLHCLNKAFDHGFRQITTRGKPIDKPEDLHGFKIRLPFAPSLILLFRHLGASPTAINGGEIYSALQTGIVDGQENPLVIIDTIKLYEVEKYCSITNHTWMANHVTFNKAAWERLPADLRDVVTKNFTQAAIAQRADWITMDQAEMRNLRDKGMIFNTPDTLPFREVLHQSGYYPDMRKECGEQAWALLEKYTGPLG
jgi:tripartite ATP-independent transporter DctP family solute receptor